MKIEEMVAEVTSEDKVIFELATVVMGNTRSKTGKSREERLIPESMSILTWLKTWSL